MKCSEASVGSFLVKSEVILSWFCDGKLMFVVIEPWNINFIGIQLWSCQRLYHRNRINLYHPCPKSQGPTTWLPPAARCLLIGRPPPPMCCYLSAQPAALTPQVQKWVTLPSLPNSSISDVHTSHQPNRNLERQAEIFLYPPHSTGNSAPDVSLWFIPCSLT